MDSGNICDFMPSLKIVLNVEKTLKTTIQKNLPKSQKLTRKISMAEFHYSQTILLRFTLVLLHTIWTKK